MELIIIIEHHWFPRREEAGNDRKHSNKRLLPGRLRLGDESRPNPTKGAVSGGGWKSAGRVQI
jgi:hypothetical protein